MTKKFLKLTNGATGQGGTPLAILSSEVQTVFRRLVVMDNDSIDLITVIYSEKLGSFEVEQSWDEVMAQLDPEPEPKQKFGLQWLKNYRAKF